MPIKPPTFRPAQRPTPRQSEREQDRRRGRTAERGYGARWNRASAAFKAMHPLCLGCKALGRIELATVTDHVVPHHGDAAQFWDVRLWQPACRWHHDVIKQRLEARYAEGRATVDDLWLNSACAQRLARDVWPDRWPAGGGSNSSLSSAP